MFVLNLPVGQGGTAGMFQKGIATDLFPQKHYPTPSNFIKLHPTE
jgi:hypothetical protein